MDIKPVFIDKPWGGTYISECFNLPIKRILGEAFLLSTLDNQENMIGEEELSKKIGKLPYLIKLIDANDNLSIQVHPDDHHAKILENSVGKTECWLIADVRPGSGIYYGLKDGVTKETFYDHVSRNDDVVSLLNFIPVKKNDFIVVPAGTIHAIGAGVRIIEFQQSSGITYRIWDWGREGRELHIEKALKVSNPTQNAPKVINFSDIQLSKFFEHDDFGLEKVADNQIVCSSPVTSYKVIFNLEDYKFSLQV